MLLSSLVCAVWFLCVVPLLYFNIDACKNKQDRTFRIYSAALFIFLSLAFAFVGRTLMATLERSFTQFHRTIRREAVFTVVAQVVTYFVRAGLNIYSYSDYKAFNEWYNRGIQNNAWQISVYLFFYTVFADILPMVAQLLSLHFSLKQKERAVRFIY